MFRSAGAPAVRGFLALGVGNPSRTFRATDDPARIADCDDRSTCAAWPTERSPHKTNGVCLVPSWRWRTGVESVVEARGSPGVGVPEGRGELLGGVRVS